MILSNTEILKASKEGRIIINPTPPTPFDTTALDLRLDSIILIPKKDLCATILPGDKPLTETLKTFYDTKILGENDTYCLKPNSFILAQTFETIELPLIPDENGYYLAARIEGKSSRARWGMLVHFTAPTIHAAFKGNLALEIINLGKFPITLVPGMEICQLIFELVIGKPDENLSHFQGQTNPAGYS